MSRAFLAPWTSQASWLHIHVGASRASAGMNPTESKETCGRWGILDGRERHTPELADVNRCGLGVNLFAKQVWPSTASLAAAVCDVVVNPRLNRDKLGWGRARFRHH
jgi:hypothetical protein